eukprot:NODE_6636_length_861_cov_28.168022_g6038_i0.p1 GENE.NODE_6636_length_861_cov_28.168022_g6038_i0~~NODE_6636_length_861_cov_28.168022_g6038_i0.p1  ORF type:complete len:183 (-),score=28.58 NODE_6636_length_861_cov_28.168022_g6038_i0:253-801(-)
MSAVKSILRLGNPLLRKTSIPVLESTPSIKSISNELHQALALFRKSHGFGRAISAPQLGYSYRIIAADLGQGPITLYNPEVYWHSKEYMYLWDDCMSIPDIIVRLKRSKSISIRFVDDDGNFQHWEKLPADQSELFQHEMDHLDGVMMVDLAAGPESIIFRNEYLSNKKYYDEIVDHISITQ